jgi:YD repeat-containing protein
VGVVYPDRTQQINLQAASTSFTPASVSGNTIVKDSRYLDETLFQFRNGNPQQVIPHSGVALSYIWDYLNQHPIAKVSGATVDQVAYTSFEADGSGGWTIPSVGRVPSTAITGSYSYSLGNGNITRSGLTSSSTYVVSYWSTNRSPYAVTGSTSVKQGKTITINSGTWTYFEHTVTGVGTVTISGSGDIDELRCYPAMAQMQTYTYTPLVGMTSQCDVANRITYYYYDGLGRLSYIKDQDGNIVKTFGYHYMNQSTGNSGL